MNNKVFCLGLSKTGTTSMGHLFRQLGFSVCYENINTASNESEINNFCDSVVDNYSFFQDLPWPKTYVRYINRFPDSKFILTYRPIDKWLNSMAIYGKKEIPLHQHIYGNSVYSGNESQFRDFYVNHINKVVDSFIDEPGRLLLLNIENHPYFSLKTVQGFLGISPDSTVRFPHSNKGNKNMLRWMIKRSKWKRLARLDELD